MNKNLLRKTTQEQRDKIIELLIADKYEEASTIVRFFGYTDGITSKFFEDLVEVEKMHDGVIKAIKVYYKEVQ